ncbi:hypothetical protein PV728_47975 [Streptomyces europaeiscabiei]|uniref:hypothetical protein n=1 Tax=Streptomyces europaeiscabiei TaxID=146819 RepID=UPI0029A2F8FC|nr:hypothetical protein [Streptomyces europaeiscabiei]MDX3637789.1 hypothetical protein [Streptomyces europaeiscabiei]MDX3655601.1 hypothetical protein [Streptomyces europaeiscabiei]
MTSPLTEQQLHDIDALIAAYRAHPSLGFACCSAHPAADASAALVAEIRRLRADAAAELLPAWEAMYEPGNVSDYLIAYTNSEAAAKGAAEAWLRSQKDEVGSLEWVPQNPLDGYDTEFELNERHDDGIDTGPGITVRHRTPAV